MLLCGYVEHEVFKGNSVQKELDIWTCILRAFRATEIVLEDFNVMVIERATGVHNFDQEGREPVLMMMGDQG